MDFDDQIYDVLVRYGQLLDNFYALDKIPEKKLLNALQYYQIPETSEILGLLDTTVFGSAKTGLAITTSGLYWRNSSGIGEEFNALGWTEVHQLLPTLANSKYSLIFKPGYELDMSGSTAKQSELIALLNELVPLFGQLIDDVNQDVAMEAVTELLPQTLAVMTMNEGTIDNAVVGQAIAAVQGMQHLDHAKIFSELTSKLQHYLTLGQQSMALIQLEQATLLAKWQALTTEQKQALKQIIQPLKPQSTLAQHWQNQLQAMN